MNEQMKNLPMVALRGMTILPSMIVHFDISRDKSIKAVEHAMLEEQKMFVVTQRDPEQEEPQLQGLYRIGTVVEIKQVVKLPNDIFRVLAEGLYRAELIEMDDAEGYLKAETACCEKEPEHPMDTYMKEAMLRNLKELFGQYSSQNGKMSKEIISQIMEMTKLDQLVDQIGINIPLYFEEKQKILEAVDLFERYELLCVILNNESNVLKIKRELQDKVKERVDKNQREYLLREQLKVIREELGEDNVLDDADHYQEQLKELNASDIVKEKISKEIERFKGIGNNSSESSVIRGYIETLLEMPWDFTSPENQDLLSAKKVLEADHYGLSKVKERIMEFLAVRILTKKGDSPILCLVGPPGTGKTSIARSVARALNKKYVRICLGGVRDEAEIRGHRRTYIGAMPGRIANGIRTAGVKNPLMLLDEIDKVSSDYKGDTSSALLEVLDSEQNSRFRDHYVEIPVDLSEVLFIATANDVQTIPRPLLDRMELIEISSYTENEKFHIAREHLVAKQIERNGLTTEIFSISDAAIRAVIGGYTKEAGVRSLERKIGEMCRKAAREILEKNKSKVTVTEGNLARYLGRKRYSIHEINESDEIGIVRGLAWTSVGGETLQIEVNTLPGKGDFLLTGQLGDVMKESAQAGISYIRSLNHEYRIPEDYFKQHDIHIHIPEGAVPKDGPSAGVTMAAAMISAITGIPARADVAMTGEITLRGRVLPVGGLKEKLLAAKNAGIRMVFVPAKNRTDIEEIPAEIKKGMDIRLADNMQDILPELLVHSERKERA